MPSVASVCSRPYLRMLSGAAAAASLDLVSMGRRLDEFLFGLHHIPQQRDLVDLDQAITTSRQAVAPQRTQGQRDDPCCRARPSATPGANGTPTAASRAG